LAEEAPITSVQEGITASVVKAEIQRLPLVAAVIKEDKIFIKMKVVDGGVGLIDVTGIMSTWTIRKETVVISKNMEKLNRTLLLISSHTMMSERVMRRMPNTETGDRKLLISSRGVLRYRSLVCHDVY